MNIFTSDITAQYSSYRFLVGSVRFASLSLCKGIYLRPTLRQTSGLNVTRDWKNPLFSRVGTVFPYRRFLFISGTPISVVIVSGRSLRNGVLV